MAIGIAEAIGQQGDLRLPTRSVAATKSPLDKFAQKGRVPTRDLTTTIAQKLITFDKPVLPGDENERTNNAVMLVDGMYKKQSMDPNYNPLADREFVKAFSEFRVKENKMQDLYRRVSADIEQRQAGGAKFIDIWDVRKLTDATGPEFEAAKAAYNGGDKFAEVDIRTQYPWTKAVGTEFKLENVDLSVTKGGRNITQKGWDENAKDAEKVSREEIKDRWLGSGSGYSKALLQIATTELMDEAKQKGGDFDPLNPTNKELIKEKAYQTAYAEFLAQNEMTKKDLKRGGFTLQFGGAKGGNTQTYKDGVYEFGAKNQVPELGEGSYNVISYVPTDKPKRQAFKDAAGNDIKEAAVRNLYYDDGGNIVGAQVSYVKQGSKKTAIVPYSGNETQIGVMVPNLDNAYKNYSGSEKGLKKTTTQNQKGADTRSFVPDFLNDALKNIGDFLRPRAPEPPQPGGPDVTGMV